MNRQNLMVSWPRGRVKVRISGFSGVWFGFGGARSSLRFTGPFLDSKKGTDPINVGSNTDDMYMKQIISVKHSIDFKL